eukprot:3216776-Lingulodinium_polyedra.AAC.1
MRFAEGRVFIAWRHLDGVFCSLVGAKVARSGACPNTGEQGETCVQWMCAAGCSGVLHFKPCWLA